MKTILVETLPDRAQAVVHSNGPEVLRTHNTHTNPFLLRDGGEAYIFNDARLYRCVSPNCVVGLAPEEDALAVR